MSKLIAIMSMSLDGYIADNQDGVAQVFDWYSSGEVEIEAGGADAMTCHLSPPSAQHYKRLVQELGQATEPGPQIGFGQCGPAAAGFTGTDAAKNLHAFARLADRKCVCSARTVAVGEAINYFIKIGKIHGVKN